MSSIEPQSFFNRAVRFGAGSSRWSGGLLGNMEETEHIVIGSREGWGQNDPFDISVPDRRHHVYIVGQTGTGKTTLVRNMILQDIEAGRGVAFIDPHGDASHDLLDFIPSWRIEDVVYFNPADEDYPIGFNLLRTNDKPHLVASGVVGAFKSIWKDSWGPRMEYILYATVAALLESENATLLGVQRMLSDAHYRAQVVQQVKDPMVRSFWVNEFENYDKAFLKEAVAPIQNKVGQFLMSPQIRNILGQVRSKINARFMMDNQRIFIANLSKGKLGEDKSNLLGALLIEQFQLAAMSRADTAEHERKDFHLFVDEFQSFTSDSLASILSEARKYRLCLTLSHQYLDQVKLEVKQAVFGNVGSMVCFRVGQRDAEMLEKEFGGAYASSQFSRLGNGEVCVKLMSHGQHNEPFLGKTLPPGGTRHNKRETIILRSREKYAMKREIVEDKIRRLLQ